MLPQPQEGRRGAGSNHGERGGVIDPATGLVLEDRVIDYGPEWRGCEPHLRRGEPLRRSKPRYLAELSVPRAAIGGAERIPGKLKLLAVAVV